MIPPPKKTALIGIIGQSGSGKTYSLRNCPLDRTWILDVERKGMPFHVPPQYAASIKPVKSYTEWRAVFDAAKKAPAATQPELVVIDSFTHLVTYFELQASILHPSKAGDGSFALWRQYNEFISMNIEDMKCQPFSVALLGIDELLQTTGADGATRTDQRRMKVRAKQWEGAIESQCLIVLGTKCVPQPSGKPQFMFTTGYDGVLTAKCPPWITEEPAIPNDLWPVVQKLHAGPPAEPATKEAMKI